MEYRQRIDASTTSVIALCSCGWRALVGTNVQAWAANLEHARHAHPTQTRQASAAYQQAASRARHRG